MKIVIDSGADLDMEFVKSTNISQVPLKVTFKGKTYLSGVDLFPDQFYDLIDNSDELPVTATPSVGEFENTYRELLKQDPDILSIHISSGLSGTYNTAKIAAEMMPEANITVIDSKTLSAGYGWQVEGAVKANNEGQNKGKILKIINQIQSATTGFFTLPDLKYLIAGGRIGHLKGLLASLLGIKPIITINKQDGKYYDVAKKRSFAKAVSTITDLLLQTMPEGTKLRAQICHAANLKGSQSLVDSMNSHFDCTWLPACGIGPALGAHTGRGLIGVMVAPMESYPQFG